MAYAVLCSLAQTTHYILNHDEYPISLNGKEQIVSLRKQVILLREFLEKFTQEGSSLETRMREAANEAEDVIEHFMYEHTRSSAAGRATDIEYDFGELRMVMEEINSISSEAAERNAWRSVSPAKQLAPSSSSTPAPAPAPVFPVGLEEDLRKLQDLVCGNSSKRQIIPITGMAGIGKTTLAKMVYDDPLIVGKFPVRAWVPVSQNYKIENIFADLLCSLQKVVGEGYQESRDSSTKDKVHQILMVRKYLIVLDDVWSEKAWDEIRKVLPEAINGSRILITTRLENVASHAAPSSSLHKMRLMDADQSWNLLKQIAFPKQECPPALEKIGKGIAKGCSGLPLGIVIVGSILLTAGSSWEEVAEDVRSIIQKNEEFKRIMSLSYINLPHYLRPCFLYMGGFPDNYEIRVSKLVKLWIAEGFVGQREDKSLEEEAGKYLEDLVGRNLALVTRNKSNGKIKSCSLHDFLRDLCKTIALDENVERRVSHANPDLRCLAKAYASTLRSVICFQPTESSLLGLRKLRLLRVLDVVDTHAYSLPPQVFDLFHLRYLSFGCGMEIPAATSRLRNLRTLIIRQSKGLRRHSKDELYLPLEVWMMPLLTHLVSFFDLLPNPEVEASALENLLTLSVMKKLICTKEMMAMIPNVKKLGVTYFGDKYKEDYQLENLVLLHQLEKLTLVLKADSVVGLTVSPVFPQTLRKLTLSGWRMSWDYMKTIGSLPNLQVLKLRDHACQGDTWETQEDQFRNLESLHIDKSDLKYWRTERRHFPKLKRLVLYRCFCLSEIPYDIGDIASLQLLEVDHANESLVKCVKGIKEEQQDYGNDFLQVNSMHYQGI